MLEFERRTSGMELPEPYRFLPLLQGMTVSERTVAVALAGGLSNQDIADRLGKTVYAVKFLLHRIYQKTGIPNRSALVAVMRSA